MKDKPLPKQQPCPRCQVGLMSIEHQTYFTWIKGEMITVPDFPVWTCIMCGYQEYDVRAVAWLNQIFDLHDRQIYSDEEISLGYQFYPPAPNSFFTVN